MRTDRKRPVDIDSAATLALNGLTFLAEDQQRLERFLASTGMSPDDLRANAGQLSFLAAVLEYLLQDEPLLLVFATSRGIDPESVFPAQILLTEAAGGSGGPA
jgi:hypothetical protein